jgi:hypothetical protein
MTHKKLSRNAPCPCGSGRKYKQCCWDKGFEWVEDEAGAVYRSTPMSPEVREALGQLSFSAAPRARDLSSVVSVPGALTGAAKGRGCPAHPPARNGRG